MRDLMVLLRLGHSHDSSGHLRSLIDCSPCLSEKKGSFMRILYRAAAWKSSANFSSERLRMVRRGSAARMARGISRCSRAIRSKGFSDFSRAKRYARQSSENRSTPEKFVQYDENRPGPGSDTVFGFEKRYFRPSPLIRLKPLCRNGYDARTRPSGMTRIPFFDFRS